MIGHLKDGVIRSYINNDCVHWLTTSQALLVRVAHNLIARMASTSRPRREAFAAAVLAVIFTRAYAGYYPVSNSGCNCDTANARQKGCLTDPSSPTNPWCYTVGTCGTSGQFGYWDYCTIAPVTSTATSGCVNFTYVGTTTWTPPAGIAAVQVGLPLLGDN